MKYICKPHGAKVPRVTELKGVSHPQKREVKHVIASMMGPISVLNSTKEIDKTRIELHTTTCGWVGVIASREGVKEKLRHIRPEEQKILDDIDARIAQLQAEKVEALKLAWTKGHVVTVKELEELSIN